jgi:hypothetical protein
MARLTFRRSILSSRAMARWLWPAPCQSGANVLRPTQTHRGSLSVLAQVRGSPRDSARPCQTAWIYLTRKRSLVQSQYRPPITAGQRPVPGPGT